MPPHIGALRPALTLLVQRAVLGESLIAKEENMNKDQVKGATKKVIGKVQEEAGKLVGCKEQQAKGRSRQMSGKVQETVGDFKQAVTNFNKGAKARAARTFPS